MFLLVIGALPMIQAGWDLSQGDRPQCLNVLFAAPTEDNLRTFETDLEDQSIVAGAVRPLVRQMRFAAFGDVGPKALRGFDGWLFYQPGVDYLIQPQATDPLIPAGPDAAVIAITTFREQLARRGIHLIVVPVPGKASIYTDKLSRRAGGTNASFESPTLDVIRRLRRAGVETVDLFGVFRAHRSMQGSAANLYLKQDTHWSGTGVQLAARSIAEQLRKLEWLDGGLVEFDLQPITVERHGDIVKMTQLLSTAASFAIERVACEQVLRKTDGIPFAASTDSPLLLLGDSFSRIYETDAPGSAGLAAHLAHQLQIPLTAIINDGGASTLVRQQLSRRPELLKGKRVVIWQFAERDIRFGNEGWQDVPLPVR